MRIGINLIKSSPHQARGHWPTRFACLNKIQLLKCKMHNSCNAALLSILKGRKILQLLVLVDRSSPKGEKNDFFLVFNLNNFICLCHTQRQKDPVSVSALPTGKFQRVRRFLRVLTKLAPKTNHSTSLEIFWTVFAQSGKFLFSLESFWRVWKISGQLGKFYDSLESFRTVWKVSRQLKKFLDIL